MWLWWIVACSSGEESSSLITVQLANDGPDPVNLIVDGELLDPLNLVAPFSSRSTPFAGELTSEGDVLTLSIEVVAARDGVVLETRNEDAEIVGCAVDYAIGTLYWSWSGLALEEGVHDLSCD